MSIKCTPNIIVGNASLHHTPSLLCTMPCNIVCQMTSYVKPLTKHPTLIVHSMLAATTHTHTHTPSVPHPLPPIVIPSLCSSIFPPTDCKISSLHCHTQQLLVGLCSGKILVLDALTFSHLSSLTCHRGPVQALFALSPPPPSSSDTSFHYSSPHWTSAKKKSSRNSFPDRSSLGSMSLPGSQPNSADPSPIPMSTPYSQYSESSILSNSQSTSSSGSDTARLGTRLLSFGSGFRSYYDGPESVPHLESGFVLVWDLPSRVSSDAIS